MKTVTVKASDRVVIGDGLRTIDVSSIDQLGRWVKLRLQANEHVRVEKRSGKQPEAATTQ